MLHSLFQSLRPKPYVILSGARRLSEVVVVAVVTAEIYKVLGENFFHWLLRAIASLCRLILHRLIAGRPSRISRNLAQIEGFRAALFPFSVVQDLGAQRAHAVERATGERWIFGSRWGFLGHQGLLHGGLAQRFLCEGGNGAAHDARGSHNDFRKSIA